MSIIELVDLTVRGDQRGSLVVLQGEDCFPEGLRRVYYLIGTQPKISRGFHAHKNLEQLAVCVAGSCTMLLDDGKIKESVLLDTPDKAIKIRKMIWHEMHDFSEDCILLVMASDVYDESDYIRNYAEFLEYVAKNEAVGI